MIHKPEPPADEPPFIAEVTNEPTSKGTFRPTSRIVLGSGIAPLAKRIGPHALGILTVLVSTVTANGIVKPTARTLSRAVGAFVAWNLRRLTRQTWRGQPILRVYKSGSGQEFFRPGDQVLLRREAAPALTAAPNGVAPTHREAVLAASRAVYARDRASVEQEIAARNGFESPEEIEARRAAQPPEPTDLNDLWAVQRLVKEKVDYGLALKLVRAYGADAVLNQVRWLDQRKAKNRARFVVGAIQQAYPPPAKQPDNAW